MALAFRLGVTGKCVPAGASSWLGLQLVTVVGTLLTKMNWQKSVVSFAST